MQIVLDDGGRQAAGYRGNARDCVVRAVAIATQQPYQVVYDALSTGSRSERRSTHNRRRKASARSGIDTRRKWFKDYLTNLGWVWKPTMHIGSGCYVHLKAEELPRGHLIVALSKHYAAVMDGVLYDRTDCTRDGTRCVYGYWYNPRENQGWERAGVERRERRRDHQWTG